MLFKVKFPMILAVLFLFSASPVPLLGQEVVAEIDLDDGTGAPDHAFGLMLSPDDAALYVAICGDFAYNNNRLVLIDTATNMVVNEATTGLYPEEIAFKLNGGAIELIFVSNSTDGSITVLKPDLTHEATIDLTAYPWTGAYPFGLIMDPSGRYLYATTFNEGELFVIDTAAGPDYLTIVNMANINGGNARMALWEHFLVIPGSDWFIGATIKLVDIIDPLNPVLTDTLILDSNMSGYPGANDVVVDNDRAYVPVLNWSGSPYLFEVDLAASALVVSRVIDTSTKGPAYSLMHGIGGSPDGNTLVVTFMDNAAIKAVGSKAGCTLFSMDVEPYYGQINEAVFTSDGETVYLSSQTDPKVYVVEGIPKHGLYLTGTESVPLNGDVDLELIGGQDGAKGLLFLSLTLGPIVTPQVTLDIGWPFFTLLEGFFGVDNELAIPSLTVPNDPALQGLVLYFQGLTKDDDAEFRASNLHTLNIL